MAEIIRVPRLSDTMTEGKVAKWNFKVGDTIKEGDVIAEIETDKAVQEFESEFDGTLLYVGVEEGQAKPVDEILAIIGQSGEDVSGLVSGGAAPAPTADATTEAPAATSAPAEIPAGVHIINAPRLTDTMAEAKVAKWNFKVGDAVKEGDVITEIETDKAVQEFETEFDGTLLYIGIEEGQSKPVDEILAIVGPAGTDVTAIVAAGGAPAKAVAPAVASANTPTASTTTTSTPNNNSGRIFASPLAKKIANDKGIDLSQVQGSGDNGRIIKKDVESFSPSAAGTTSTTASASTSNTVAAAKPSATITPGVDVEMAVTPMRNAIAKNLTASLFTAPHFNVLYEVNMDAAIEARKAINALPDTKVSFNDMVIKAASMALRKHPAMNSSWLGNKIVQHGNINMGMAVAVENGLVVPVINHSDFLSLTEISATSKDLAGKAKANSLKPAEMSGSTFTISNLGMFGAQSFNSIINQPNSAILSVGAISEQPIVKNGQIVVGNVMYLSLAVDHRTVDGSVAAQFMQTLKAYLENPVNMLA